MYLPVPDQSALSLRPQRALLDAVREEIGRRVDQRWAAVEGDEDAERALCAEVQRQVAAEQGVTVEHLAARSAELRYQREH